MFIWGLIFIMPMLALAQQNKGQLVTVIVFYRHGDRTPVDPYPTDPYRNMSYWPVDYGQLTNLGKQQQYALGKWLRERYDGFLPEEYNEKDIYIRSTDVDRTLMSAYTNLAALYSPDSKQHFNPSLNWQPIPVHTKPETEDYLLAMKKPCPRFIDLQKDLLKSPEFSQLIRRNHDLFAYLSRNAGKAVTSIETLEFIYNTLFIESVYNLTLPEWTKKVYPDKMRPLAELSFAIPCYTEELARLKTGPLFHEIVNNLYNVSQSAGNHSGCRKMWVYSGHDTTIANVLNTLRIFELHSPPYASMILFELYSRQGDYYLNIFYKNTTEARIMKLPNCDIDCPLGTFAKILERIVVTPDQWHSECEASIFPGNLSVLQDVVMAACVLMFLMLICSIVAGTCFAKPKNNIYQPIPSNDQTA